MAASEANRLVEQHLSLVQALARKVKRTLGTSRAIDLEDLVAYGSKGLVHITSLEAASTVADESLPAPDAAVDTGRLSRRVREAVAQLPDKERELMQLYYFADKTLEEAGAALGLSKSWASRLHARAVSLLREALDAG